MLVVVSAKNPKTGLELQKVHNNNEVVMVDVKGARARDKIDISIKHTVTGSGVIAQYSMSHHVSRRRTPRSGKPVDRPNFHRRSTWRARKMQKLNRDGRVIEIFEPGLGRLRAGWRRQFASP